MWSIGATRVADTMVGVRYLKKGGRRGELQVFLEPT
jgi:hypothetical protein